MNILTSVDTIMINAINTNVSLSQSLLANILMMRIFVDLSIHPFFDNRKLSRLKTV